MSERDRGHGGHGHGHGHGAHGHGDGGHGHAHGGHGHGAPGHDHPRDKHGNPEDFEHYLARLEDPERAAWQKPDEVIRGLGLREGAVACDLGAGPGVFTIRLARAVGPRGRVHAIDVDPRMIALLESRLKDAGVSNVRPLLAPDDGGVALPPEPCDAILTVNALHHFPDPAATLRRLATALAPGGAIAIVDFHGGELPVGPPPDHKLSRDAFLDAARAAGLEVAREETFLPYQYFVLLRSVARR